MQLYGRSVEGEVSLDRFDIDAGEPGLTGFL